MSEQEINEKLEEIYDLILEVLRDSEPPNCEQETLDQLQKTAWHLQDVLDVAES